MKNLNKTAHGFNRTNSKKSLGGFTIIEVMIVLAIAGLIMVVVLIAAPQLQRSQRNAARKDVAGRIKTEVDNYAGNNNGLIPTANAVAGTGFNTGGGFYTRYISTNASQFNDPQTGLMVFNTWTSDNSITASTIGTIFYTTGRVCTGETSTSTGAGVRNYILMTALEGGAVFCLGNQ